MAVRKKTKLAGSDEPSTNDELASLLAAAKGRVEARRGARSASDVVNNDKEPRKTFSLRLDARELHRLRVVAMLEHEGVTELARRLVLEGLAGLELKHLADSDGARLAGLVERVKNEVGRLVLDTFSEAAPAGLLMRKSKLKS